MGKILAALLAFGLAGQALAIQPSASTFAVLEQRIADIDVSLGRLRSEFAAGTIKDSQKSNLVELQRSLEAEKRLLEERKVLLRRLEAQGLLMYVNQPEVQQAVPADGSRAAREPRR